MLTKRQCENFCRMLYNIYEPISLPFVGCLAHWCKTSTFFAIQKKDENETDTVAMLKIEPEAVVHNDITKHLPKFSGFGHAFRSTMTMMEDEMDVTNVTMLASAISLFHIAAQLVVLFFRWDGLSEPSSPSTLWQVRRPMLCCFHALWSSSSSKGVQESDRSAVEGTASLLEQHTANKTERWIDTYLTYLHNAEGITDIRWGVGCAAN